MNNLNYPLTNDYRVNILSEKSGIETLTNLKEKKLGFTVNSKLDGKIKFVLGSLYFFSLTFFMLQLLT